MVVTPAQAGVHVSSRRAGFPLPVSAGTSFAGMTFGLMISEARKLRFEDVLWTKKSGCWRHSHSPF